MNHKQLLFVTAASLLLSACARKAPAQPPVHQPDEDEKTVAVNPTKTMTAGVRLPVGFTAPGKGFISLALYDKGGVLVRSLLYAKPVEAGKGSIDWDGTTDMGKPAPTGGYTAKGVFFTESPSLKYEMIVGKSGNPPWRTADGKGDWGGNLGFPSSLATNGKSLIMGYACVEDNQVTGIQQMDGDGNIQTRYFTFYPWDVRMAAAMDDTNYYLGILNGSKKQIEIAEYKLGEPRGKIKVVLPTTPHKNPMETRWNGYFTAWLDGIALTADTIYATVGADNNLFIIDRASGQIRKTISLPAPRGIAASNGKLLVVSGKAVLRLSLQGETEATVVPEGKLQSPGALAVDGAGNIYVGDGGALGTYGILASGGTRQVCVFSAAGKPLRAIGKPGGAPPEGRFDENGLGVITSLVVAPGADGQPALWVNDIATGFPRTSRWSLDGALQRQWFGRKLSLYSDVFNPARPNELLYTSGAFADEPGISAYEMDVAKKTWRPAWHYETTWADMFQENVFLSHKHGGNPLNASRGPESRWPVFHYASRNFVSHGGHNYFMLNSGNDNGAIFEYGPDHKPKPIALVSYHRAAKTADGKIEGFYDQGPNNWFNWADRNGDGKMAMDEIIYTGNPEILSTTQRVNEATLDSNLNILMKRAVREDGKNKLVDSILEPTDILPNGAPVYDWGKLRDLTPLAPPDLTGGDGVKEIRGYQMPNPIETTDSFYSMVEAQPAERLLLPGIDGQGWWASRNWRTKVARWDKKTGKNLWAVGRRAPGKVENGQMYHPAALAGVEGGAVFVTDTLGPVWVWTTDGLFLGHVYNDFASGIQDDQTLYGEIQATQVFTDPKTKKIFAIANDTGAHIHEVILPRLTPLTAGAVLLSAPLVAKVQPWDPDGVAPTDKPVYRAYFTTKPMNIDGDLRDWSLGEKRVPIVSSLILMDGQRLADVRATYDAQNLYLAYNVSAANGALNSGSELPLSPFVSGAYVDFTVAPNWTGPRSDVREGDVRVLLARIKDGGASKDFQQGFWQKKAGGQNPQTITSPAATVKFDQIAEVPGLQMAYKVGGTDGKTGLTSYSVEVSVPLASLGLANPTGKTIGFDASVAVSNAEGNRRERAAHWAGLSEAVVVDRPGSTRLLPDTWGTLKFLPAPQ